MTKFLKKILLSPWTALITLAVLISVRAADPSFVESVRLRYFDTLITSQPSRLNNITVVNIDEAALDKWGQWPFPRTVYADMIKDLYAHGAGLVVWNVLMPEPDRFGGDAQLADTLRDHPTVLSNIPAAVTKNSPRKPGSAVVNSQFGDRIIHYPGLIANIPELEAPAWGVGTVNTLPEIDGVNRRMPLVIAVDGKIYPSLGMETLRVLAKDSTVQVKLSEIGIDKMRIPKFGSMTTDNLGRVWIDWSQQSEHYSISKLPDDLHGAVVIVGVSAAGIGNPVSTARGAVWPQDVQAAVLGTMINKVNIQRPDWADGAEILALAAAGIILIGMARWTYVGIGTMVVVVVASIVGSRWGYSEHRFLWDATAITAGSVVVALHAYVVKFVSEFLQKQQIKKQFGGYVSPIIIERLQKNPELIKLGGETRELSVIMTDMRNFTSLGESYGDRVEEFTNTMNSYMTAIAEPILRNDGCLIKFIGDASLHVHNAPLDDKNHAKNAVKTSLEMIAAVNNFNLELAAQGKPPVGMGVGVNTGPTLIGNIGSKTRFGYDVLGDTVSLASRLEGQSKPYHVAMVIGDRTNEYVKDEYFTLPLDCIAVKGKKEGVRIHTVLPCESFARWEQYRTQHLHMMADYNAQRFSEAIRACQSLKGQFNGQMDGYYDMWIERCTEMSANSPGDGWDRIYRTNTK